jgi:alpha-glucosidase
MPVPRVLSAAAAALALASALPAARAAADAPLSLGAVQSVTCAGATCAVVAAVAGGAQPATVPLRLTFYAPSIVRWWLAVDGNFSDTGAADDVIVAPPSGDLAASAVDAGAYWEVSAPGAPVVARLAKAPAALLSLYVGGALVAAEAAPLAWNATSSWQTLARDAAATIAPLSAEYFYGAGMQNGRWAHRGETVQIGVDYNWEDGGHPNSAPWYVSSAGYGVLRNTWAPGAYSFAAPVTTAHNESTRLDAFFLLGGDLRATLGLYTALTGPPFLPPLYGLFLGDSDCYHNDRHGNSTRVVLAVAQAYHDNDMPGGWFLPNDGYGCGYGEPGDGAFPSNLTDLTYVVAELHALGFYTGLWTSTGMPNISAEVGVAGTRICKTDVGAWLGGGGGRARCWGRNPAGPGSGSPRAGPAQPLSPRVPAAHPLHCRLDWGGLQVRL